MVRFIRHQMIDVVQSRLLFTKIERFLIRNQIRPFVINQHLSVDGQRKEHSDSSDWQPRHVMSGANSPFFAQLLEGVKVRETPSEAEDSLGDQQEKLPEVEMTPGVERGSSSKVLLPVKERAPRAKKKSTVTNSTKQKVPSLDSIYSSVPSSNSSSSQG